jgi:ATP-dependent DNA helicase RecQ
VPGAQSAPVDTTRLELARQALQRHYGFSDLREGQARAIRQILALRDSLIVLPTGGGKSLCYQLPALILPGLTIVVSPLIALMDDQVQALRRRGISAASLHSGLTPDAEKRTWRDAESGLLRLLYLSPERLLLERTLERLSAHHVAVLAIDEAHCVCQWGYDFRPDYLRLALARRRLKPGVTVALTATATPATRLDIVRVLELNHPHIVVSGFDRPNLNFAVQHVNHTRERLARIRSLVRSVSPAPAIVYAGTRSGVEAVARYLGRGESAIDCYHAGRSPIDRAQVQERFLHGDLRVLVATNAFGMGVDKPDVRLVVHLAPPGSIEDYYQEAGRASRDGAPGRCIVLSGEGDRHLHERFLKRSYPPAGDVGAFWRRLLALADPSRAVVLEPPEANGPVSARLTSPDRALLDVLVRHHIAETTPALPGTWRVRLLVTCAEALRAAERSSSEARLLIDALVAARTQPGRTPFSTLDDLATALDGDRLHAAAEELIVSQILYRVPPATHIRLLSDAQRVTELPIDWPLRRAREAIERAKLDAMHDYVNTRRCRRWFLLRYFGQHPTPTACGDCDNCTQAGPGAHGRFVVFLRTTLRRARDGARVRP